MGGIKGIMKKWRLRTNGEKSRKMTMTETYLNLYHSLQYTA